MNRRLQDQETCEEFKVPIGIGRGLNWGVLQAKGGRGMSSYKFSSVGARFKKQLAELMSALHTMEPHYIRCIKPNSRNRPMDFESNNVLHQLRCGGVLEAVGTCPTCTFQDDIVRTLVRSLSWILACAEK